MQGGLKTKYLRMAAMISSQSHHNSGTLIQAHIHLLSQKKRADKETTFHLPSRPQLHHVGSMSKAAQKGTGKFRSCKLQLRRYEAWLARKSSTTGERVEWRFGLDRSAVRRRKPQAQRRVNQESTGESHTGRLWLQVFITIANRC